MPAPGMSYKKLRRQLDDLGYYQPLVPEALPLVEALFHDLLGTTHNLKICKENKICDCGKSARKSADEQIEKQSENFQAQKEVENVKIIGLQKKLEDVQLLYQVIRQNYRI